MTRDEAKALEPAKRRALLEGLRAQMKPIQAEIYFLEGTCTHTVKALTETAEEYYKKDEWRCDSGHCAACGEDMGWYCPVALNHICNYEQEDGTYNDDDCIHCHMPDERK